MPLKAKPMKAAVISIHISEHWLFPRLLNFPSTDSSAFSTDTHWFPIPATTVTPAHTSYPTVQISLLCWFPPKLLVQVFQPNVIIRIAESTLSSLHHRRMVWARKNLRDHLVQMALLWAGTPSAGSIQLAHEHFQGQGIHKFSRESVSVLHHPHSEEFISSI